MKTLIKVKNVCIKQLSYLNLSNVPADKDIILIIGLLKLITTASWHGLKQFNFYSSLAF